VVRNSCDAFNVDDELLLIAFIQVKNKEYRWRVLRIPDPTL
jgi:hypothetical protein